MDTDRQREFPWKRKHSNRIICIIFFVDNYDWEREWSEYHHEFQFITIFVVSRPTILSISIPLR